MTRQEFSNEFDVLYNNISSNQAPGLDEYEKSVFLTKAQYEVLKNYFNPKGNKYQEGFDGSQKRQIDFSKLIAVMAYSGEQTSSTGFLGKKPGVYRVKWPTDVFIVINEFVDVIREGKNYQLQVIPIRYDEYIRVCSKPYKHPLKNQAWRILAGAEGTYLIIGPLNSMDSNGYRIRYIRKPKPIILETLPDNLTIDGTSDATDCELDSELHPEILQRAVELAKAAYAGDLQNNVELGKRSE